MSEDVLKITITAAGQQASAELQKVAQSLSGVTREAQSTRTAHQNLAKDVEGLGKQFEQLANKTAFLASGFKSFRAIFVEGAGVFGIATIINQTMQWDDHLAHLAQTMNGDVKAASQWLAITSAFNVPLENVTTGMQTLSMHIAANSPVLRQMGIATQDAHGQLLSMDQILQEVTQHFRDNATATDIAGQARELFGRGGSALLPVLTAEASTLKAITDQATALGLVIDGKTLMSFRQMDAEVRGGVNSLGAMALAIGHGLMPAFAAAGQAISSFVIDHLEQLKAAIMDVVSFIIGFFEAFTGGSFKISPVAQAIASASQATNDFGTAAGGATNATKALTDALQDQIKAIDEQIKGLQEATALENYQDSLAKAKRKATDDKKKVDLDYSTYQADLLQGFQAQAMDSLTQLNAAQQTAADDQTTIQKLQDDEGRRIQVNSLNEEKARLQDRIAAIQDAAAKGTAAIGAQAAKIPGLYNAAAAQAGNNVKVQLTNAAEQAGKNFANQLKGQGWTALGDAIGRAIAAGIIAGIGAINWGTVMKTLIFQGHPPKDASSWLGWFNNLLRSTPGIGGTVSGVEDLIKQLNAGSSYSGATPDLGGGSYNNPYLPGHGIGAYASGGVISGPAGAPRLILGHGKERVLNESENKRYESGGSQSTVVHQTFYVGSVDSEDRLNEIRRVAREAIAAAFAT